MRLWPTVWIVCFSSERQRHSVEARRGIATKAAELISGRETIIADASTTALEALRTVGDKSNLTVVIDSLKICGDSIDVSFYLISTGGIYRWESLPFQGGRDGDCTQVSCGSCRAESQGKTLSLPILTT